MDLFGAAFCDAAAKGVCAAEAYAIVTTDFPRRPTPPVPKPPHEKCNLSPSVHLSHR